MKKLLLLPLICMMFSCHQVGPCRVNVDTSYERTIKGTVTCYEPDEHNKIVTAVCGDSRWKVDKTYSTPILVRSPGLRCGSDKNHPDVTESDLRLRTLHALDFTCPNSDRTE